MQQQNNFKKKVYNALKKSPDLTKTYQAFILFEGEVDRFFKLGITLDRTNNYQSAFFLESITVY